MDLNAFFNSIMENAIVRQILLWAALGLGVGVVAKIIIPGSEEIGWIRTICVGLAGSFLGNFVAPKLFDWPTYAPFSMEGVGIGIAGAVVLVVINRIVTKS